jgi:hypothetical protein
MRPLKAVLHTGANSFRLGYHSKKGMPHARVSGLRNESAASQPPLLATCQPLKKRGKGPRVVNIGCPQGGTADRNDAVTTLSGCCLSYSRSKSKSEDLEILWEFFCYYSYLLLNVFE